MSRIVILGGGTAGTMMANRLRRRFAGDVKAGATHITVVDQDDVHIYQPGLLFIPFGIYQPEDVVRPRHRQLHDAIEYRQSAIERVLPDENVVELAGGERLAFDVLIVATGTRIAPEETDRKSTRLNSSHG